MSKTSMFGALVGIGWEVSGCPEGIPMASLAWWSPSSRTYYMILQGFQKEFSKREKVDQKLALRVISTVFYCQSSLRAYQNSRGRNIAPTSL